MSEPSQQVSPTAIRDTSLAPASLRKAPAKATKPGKKVGGGDGDGQKAPDLTAKEGEDEDESKGVAKSGVEIKKKARSLDAPTPRQAAMVCVGGGAR
mmetsp:Transcript_43807/g.70417  ORF Transcript_43807/g.70417 Transcript_43807/m.70417 type:complete len:97 (+) Transcript_43807:501-791(+)